MLLLFSSFMAWSNPPPITNGQLETGFPSVVSLGAEFNGYLFSACTGNLITPRVVITAAHCGGDIPLELVVEIGRAFIGPTIQEHEHALTFEDLTVHPEYRELGTNGPQDTGVYDLALLTVSEDAPVAPTMFLTGPLEGDLQGTPLFSVGFGITGPNQNDSGIKRSVDLVLSGLDNMFVTVNNADNDSNANICSGDSGGPMFHYDTELGQYVQWAVHSWGDQNCSYTSGSTRLDIVNEWIFDYIEQVHGSRDLCEVNGFYDDDECTELEICGKTDPACVVAEEEAEETDELDEAKESESSTCSFSPTGSLMLFLVGFLGSLRRQDHHR